MGGGGGGLTMVNIEIEGNNINGGNFNPGSGHHGRCSYSCASLNYPYNLQLSNICSSTNTIILELLHKETY